MSLKQPLSPIYYYDRYAQRLKEEKVLGAKEIQWLYSNPLGLGLEWILSFGHFASRLGGLYYDSKASTQKIAPFIQNYQIDTSEFRWGSQTEAKDFASSFENFNEFFCRDFIPGARHFTSDKSLLTAPAEGRYFAAETLHDIVKFPVKGEYLKPSQLLPIEEAAWFEDGPLLVARLCPVDYHQYHYPDDGKTVCAHHVRGRFHSVNPWALRAKPNIFIKNDRRISILETKNFGALAYIEVGALMVGSIIQKHPEGQPFKRGQVKGEFRFGGSTVIIIGEKGRWSPSEDLLANSYKGTETFVRLGDAVGLR